MARPRRVIEDSDDDDEASPAAAVVLMDVDDGGEDDDSLEEPRPPSPSPLPPAPPAPPPRPAPRRGGGRHARLRSRLSSQAGVDPSPAWLDACVRHVGGEDEEAAWDQILRADLRDVVRVEPGDGGDGDGGDDEGGKGPAARLREAVAKSSSAAGEAGGGDGTNGRHRSRKAALPSDFRLLVQVEEVVDVTMSADQQLAAGGGATGGAAAGGGGATGPSGGGNPYGSGGPRGAGGPQQQQRNPQYRCLKMVLSDGYHSNGRSTPPSAENGSDARDANPTFLAMETSPIQHLGTSSPPGIKLLLHGAIDVRVGMLQLNEGNCAVLGGSVEGWGEAMRKARERAARERGLGVDPTIKALIWNPLTGDEEEMDEGEGESGDVAAAPPPLPAAPVAPAPPPPPHPTPAPNNNAYPNARTPSQYTNQSRGSSAPNASLSGTGSGTMRQRTLDSYPKKPRPDTTRLRPGDDAPASNWQQRTIATQSRGASNNPYQRASAVDPGRNAPSGVEAPPRQQQQQRQPQQHQQHQQQQHQQHQRQMQTNTNIIPVNGSPPSSTSQTTSIQPQQRAQPNPYASLRPAAAESHPSAAAKTPAPAAKSAATSFTSNPSFSELISMLQSVRSDRALYERYYGRVITVPCKINGKDSKDNVFNIVKSASPGGGSEKKKGKSKKKYEFFLVAKFFGPKQSDGAVACRVESSVLERYFDGYSPAEVRKLSREDKAATNRVVNQSCSQFVHDFSSLGQVQMKLLLTPDEFFAKVPTLSASDWFAGTANPFLLAIKRT
ncbi:hypothetical protein ACHAWF_018429 [Thalassiosira exigua]